MGQREEDPLVGDIAVLAALGGSACAVSVCPVLSLAPRSLGPISHGRVGCVVECSAMPAGWVPPPGMSQPLDPPAPHFLPGLALDLLPSQALENMLDIIWAPRPRPPDRHRGLQSRVGAAAPSLLLRSY